LKDGKREMVVREDWRYRVPSRRRRIAGETEAEFKERPEIINAGILQNRFYRKIGKKIDV
jgi:hypothetical protein